MTWSYDATSASLYIRLASGTPARQDELADGTILDIAADGSVLGVEILRLTSGWTSDAVRGRLSDADLTGVAFVAQVIARGAPRLVGNELISVA